MDSKSMRSQDTKSQAHWMKPGDTETGLGSVDQMATQFKDCSFKDYSQSSCFFPTSVTKPTDPTDGIASVGNGLRFKLMAALALHMMFN